MFLQSYLTSFTSYFSTYRIRSDIFWDISGNTMEMRNFVAKTKILPSLGFCEILISCPDLDLKSRMTSRNKGRKRS